MSNFEQIVKYEILNARTGVLSVFTRMKFCLAGKFFTVKNGTNCLAKGKFTPIRSKN
jgi:hypothetical protein